MSKVTVILGPPVGGRSAEARKVIDDRKVMTIAFLPMRGLRNDPFHIQKLLLKAHSLGCGVIHLETGPYEPELFRSVLLVLTITGFPVDVIIESQTIKQSDISSFEPYIDLIVKS